MTLFDPQFKIAVARRRIYSLLAAFFRHPSRHPQSDEALELLLKSADALPTNLRSGKDSIDDFKQLAAETLRERGAESSEFLAAEYKRLFGPAGAISLDEASSAKMLSFLQARMTLSQLGRQIETSGDPCADPSPARILSELEFMQCMVAAESECVMEEQRQAAKMCRRKQIAFLRGRLLAWFSDFAADVSPASDFYRLLFAVTDLFSNLDARYLSRAHESGARPNSYATFGASGEAGGPCVSVDKDSCSLCGVCESVCAARAMLVEKEGNSIRLKFLQRRCTGCEACARSCPEKAITVDTRAADAPTVAVLFESGLDSCPRCGEANDLAPLAGIAIQRLGDEASGALREKLLLCRRCRVLGRGSGGRHASPGPSATCTNVRLPFFPKNEVLKT